LRRILINKKIKKTKKKQKKHKFHSFRILSFILFNNYKIQINLFKINSPGASLGMSVIASAIFVLRVVV